MSGDKKGLKTSDGSRLCRKAMWQWVFSSLEPKKRRLDNPTVKALCEYLDSEKAGGRPTALVRSRVAVKAVKLLFSRLVDAAKHVE